MRPILLTIIFVGFSMSMQAQQKACSVNSTTFACLDKWSDIKIGSYGAPFVAVHSDSKVTLFVSQLTDNDTSADAYERALLEILNKGLSIDPSRIKIKDSRDFWGDSKYSRFEETKGAKALLDIDAREFLGIHYSVFSYDGKRFIAGFVRLIVNGERSKERFEEWVGGGGSGDYNLRELIFLITKEGEQTTLPGGPPPAAPARLPGGPPPIAPRPKTI